MNCESSPDSADEQGHFEVGPIRPPSEAYSLLVRVTRNCPWNKCTFCPVYKRRKFSPRPVEDVEKDIEAMAAAVREIRQVSRKLGLGGRVDRRVVAAAARSGLLDGFGPGTGQVVMWLLAGGRTVFLQDANSLVIKPDRLVRVVRKIKETFPEVDRITSYARSHSLAKVPPEKMKELGEAGLNRIHVGLESGSDRVLELVRKGCTKARHIEAGRRVLEAGIELSEYVMPGLGGEALSEEHALETADALNAINPHFIRLRTLAVRGQTPLAREVADGRFRLLSDEQMVREIRLFIENLDDELESNIVSDHILNLLEGLEGRVKDQKQQMLGMIDAFLNLPSDERLIFRLGRRLGVMRSLEDLDKPGLRRKAQEIVNQTGGDSEVAEALIRELVARFV